MAANKLASDLPPEVHLLLACSRTDVDPDTARRIKVLIRHDMDWDYLLRTGHRHGTLPLLYRSLKDICPHFVPHSVMDDLHAYFQANAGHNLFLISELLELLNLLESERITAIPFKGPVLAASAYQNLALRQFGDLDVLVKEQDFQRARNLLVARGYQPWRQLNNKQESNHLRTEHAYTFVRENERIKVDLHWRIAQQRYSFGVEPEMFWSRLDRITIGGREVPTLHPEDLLLVLCMHGSKHCWERLAWICDVAEVVRTHRGLDWERVMDQACRLNSERVFLLGLGLASDLLDAPLPDHVMSKVKSDPGVQALSLQVQKQLFSRPLEPLGPIERTALYVKMRERLQNKLPYLLYHFRLAVIPNDRDLTIFSLPAFLYFLYYPLRLIRLTATYGLNAVGRLYRAN